MRNITDPSIVATSAIAFDGTNMWVASGVGDIIEINAGTGKIVGGFGGGGGCNFDQPSGIAVHGANVWVTNEADKTVTEINASTPSCTTLSGSPYDFSLPMGIAFDGTNVWVANAGNGSVTEFRAVDGSWVRTVAGPVFGLSAPGAVTIADGRAWIGDATKLIELPPG